MMNSVESSKNFLRQSIMAEKISAVILYGCEGHQIVIFDFEMMLARCSCGLFEVDRPDMPASAFLDLVRNQFKTHTFVHRYGGGGLQ